MNTKKLKQILPLIAILPHPGLWQIERQLDISHLRPGMYYLELYGSNSRMTENLFID